MNYWKNRKKELREMDYKYDFDNVTEEEHYNQLISQEKELIRQAFQELWNNVSCMDEARQFVFDEINDLLERRQIEEIEE